jgi:DNA-binding response OmpR family regulator
MVSPSTESISGLSLIAPSPDAVAELTRPDGCVLVLGEHLGRLRDLADTPRVVRDILSTWSAVRPLVGPGDLRVDRIGGRASVRGRQLALCPADFRLLRALAEKVRRGCTVDELRAAAISGSRAADRRAMGEVRHGLERL